MLARVKTTPPAAFSCGRAGGSVAGSDLPRGIAERVEPTHRSIGSFPCPPSRTSLEDAEVDATWAAVAAGLWGPPTAQTVPPGLDLWENVLGQCRLHRVATYPILLPMASPLLKGFSARGSKMAEEANTDGGASGVVRGTFRSSPKDGSHSSGPWEGDYSREENRPGSSVQWNTPGPLGTRRVHGSGGITSISEMDATASPKDWASSSHQSPGVKHGSGLAAAGGGGGGGSGGGTFSYRDNRHQIHSSSEQLEDVEHLRSRSTTSSGLGRESFDSNNLESEERWERAATLTTGLLSHGAAPGRGGRGVGGGGGGGSSLQWQDADEATGGAGSGGDLRQTRSMSLAGVMLTGDVVMDAGSDRISALRRKSTTVDELLAGEARTPDAGNSARGEAIFSTVEMATEPQRALARAAALASRFVEEYSTSLVDTHDFTRVTTWCFGDVAMDAAVAVAAATTTVEDAARRMSYPVWTEREGEASTPNSSSFDAGGGWRASGGGGGGGGGRYNGSGRTPGGQDSGGGGSSVLARALLRYALPMTNSVALVEVSVKVESDDVRVGMPPRLLQYRHQQPHVVAETMLATVKLWTIDVVRPPCDCDEGSGSGDGGSGGEGGGSSSAWWAELPTLSSFRWDSGGVDKRVRGDGVPDELPRELAGVMDALRFRTSVEDFILGQVSQAFSNFILQICVRGGIRRCAYLGSTFVTTDMIHIIGTSQICVNPCVLAVYACMVDIPFECR